MPPVLSVSLVALLLAVAMFAARWPRRSHWQHRASAIAVLLGAALVASATVMRPARAGEAEVNNRPQLAADGGYIGSSACRACHLHEHDTWHQSYHRTMTQVVEPASVLADWDGVTLRSHDKTWNLSRDGDTFFVEMEDPVVMPGNTPGRVKRPVVMSTGSHHMQVYWYEVRLPGNVPTRLTGMLPFSWQVAERRWISRNDSFVQPETDPPQDGIGNWNLICIKCHATNARPRLDMDNTGLHDGDTKVGDFGIACEACHGPGAAHVQLQRNPLTRYAQRLDGDGDATIVDPRNLPHDRSTMVCGQCHGQFDYQLTTARRESWFKHGFPYAPGGDLLKDRLLKKDGEGQFWSDGLIRVAGREFNAVSGSDCYEKGHMTCLSCHTLHPHDGRPRAAWADDQLAADVGDRSCLQCHPTFAKDIAAHTHHAVDSEGSRCMNCHMPHTTYGLMKGVRTHRIASPSVQSTLATGRPNACNQCHLDKTLAWTADHLAGWYGTPKPTITGDEASIAAGVLWSLKGDAAQRALAAWSLGWEPARQASGSDWSVPLLAELLDDPYGVVRIIAERSLRTLPAHADLRYEPGMDAATRKVLKESVVAAWRRAPRTPADVARPAVLLRPDGSLDSDEFARLLRRRDLRVVRLEE